MKVEPITEDFGTWVRPEGAETVDALDWPAALELLTRRGLLILRGFSLDEHGFRRFTEQCGRRFMVHHNVEGRDYVDGDRSFATVAKSQKPIDFHIEMASSPARPAALWFFCVQPSADRGRIGFVDGARVLTSFTGRSARLLRDHGLCYQLRDLPREIWRPVWDAARDPGAERDRIARWMKRAGALLGISGWSTNEDDRASFDYRVPAIYRAALSGRDVFACGLLDNPRRTLLGTPEPTPVPREVLIEAYQAVYQNAVWLDWRAGDLAIVDNTRVMHAREAFEDPARRVLVRYSELRVG